MKNVTIFTTIVLLTLVGMLGCGTNESKDEKKLLELKIATKSNLKILTDPVLYVDTATNFVQRFRDSLNRYGGRVKWPIDTTTRKFVNSWSVNMKYITEMENELKKLKGVSEIGIKFYPVINNEGTFSLLLVGEYKQNGKNYILKHKVDPATGEQGTKDIAPMYEWLDPCPPLHCPENDF